MQPIFWFTGRSGSGKTTLSIRIKELLNENSIQVIDGDEIMTKLGGRQFRKNHHDDYNKKLVHFVESLSEKNFVLLISANIRKNKHRNFIQEILGDKYKEIFLQCSDQERIKRRISRSDQKNPKKPTKVIMFFKKWYKVSTLRFSKTPHEVPLSADLVIDTERLTIEESTKIAVNFIKSQYLNIKKH